MAERRSPLDLTGFAPRTAETPSNRPAPEDVARIAAETGFPSRQPAAAEQPSSSTPNPGKGTSGIPVQNVGEPVTPRDNRRRTGRNIQKNLKLTAQGVIDLEAEADRTKKTFGEILERGLAAIRKLREMGIEDYFDSE